MPKKKNNEIKTIKNYNKIDNEEEQKSKKEVNYLRKIAAEKSRVNKQLEEDIRKIVKHIEK